MKCLKAKASSTFKWVQLVLIGAVFIIPGCKKQSVNELLQEQTASSNIGLSPLSILPQTQVFNFSGTDQEFVVPAEVTQITVKAWGAGGAGGNYAVEDGYNN